MSAIEFQWQNPNAVVNKLFDGLRARGIEISEVPVGAVRRAAFELLAIAQRLAPKRTSTFVRSMNTMIDTSRKDLVEAKVGTGMKYGRYLEQGTGLYGPRKQVIEVEPTSAGGLFWGVFDSNGKPVIRRRVQIKGMRPQAIFGRAFAEFFPRYPGIVVRELNKANK